MTADRVPAHVFLDVLVECNLRCVQCDIWKLKTPPGTLTLEERRAVVRQVGAWDPSIRIVLTGGELFLDRPSLYGLADTCKEAGIYTTLSTNGTLLREADIERLPDSGIRCVVLSIDSDEPAVHDRIRGVEGTFERVTQSVQRLVTARDRHRTDFSVLTSTILGSHNLHRVRPMVDFLEGLGVDTTLFQPIQPAFARSMETDWWRVDPLFPKDQPQVDRGVDDLIELKRAGRRLYQSAAQFEDMRTYFSSPAALRPGQCASMDRSLMIDAFGEVRLCFNMERLSMAPIGSVRRQALRSLWESLEAERARARMRACRLGCGTMICHAR